jgi:hypothetical protein
VKQQKVSIDTLHRFCAGIAIAISMASCVLDSDEYGPDAQPSGEIVSGDEDNFGLWTGIRRPPYAASVQSSSRQVFELQPESPGGFQLAAALRWPELTAGEISPQVSIGLTSARSESTLLQIFASGGLVRARADLAMTDALEPGVWYRVVVTVGDAPARQLQVSIFDDSGEVWRSCGGAAACPSVQIDQADLASLRLSVIVDDAREGGQIELKNVSLANKHNP